jgi:hypothetical protein
MKKYLVQYKTYAFSRKGKLVREDSWFTCWHFDTMEEAQIMLKDQRSRVKHNKTFLADGLGYSPDNQWYLTRFRILEN